MPGGADEQQRGAAVLWSVQVDAAAGVEAVDEVDGGGTRARVGVARKKTKTRRQGENEKDPCPYL